MSERTVDQIRAEITKLNGELATLAGEGLLVWNGREGDIMDRPPGGATLTVSWAISDRSWEEWYPTAEAAKAQLLIIAEREGRRPSDSGFFVDLTSPGCHTSKAYVTRYDEESDEEGSDENWWRNNGPAVITVGAVAEGGYAAAGLGGGCFQGDTPLEAIAALRKAIESGKRKVQDGALSYLPSP